MSVTKAIDEWTRAMRCAGCTCIGSQPIRDTRNVTSAAYDIARTQCTSADDIVSKLRWAKRDCAERGVVDHVVLRLLDELIADAERLTLNSQSAILRSVNRINELAAKGVG